MPSQSTLIGPAGQHYVLCQLLRQGWVAALAPEGVPNVDIIVTDMKANRQCAIQVKARSGRGHDKGWHMGEKHEKLVSSNLYYCFVDFGDDSPTTYVIPAKVVASKIRLSHKTWLERPGKNNREHKDNPIRRLLPDYSKTIKNLSSKEMKLLGPGWMEQYRENWEILKPLPL